MSRDILTFDNVTLIYGKHKVLDHLNLCLAQGERKVIMGPSGSGKTSVFRLAAGLISPTHGSIANTAQRTAIQFQEPRLLPQLTALENINVVLSDSPATLPEAKAWLDLVELSDAADLLPTELSGGMAQRVALARALAFGGDLYLLDEPFRGMDADLKARMIALVLEKTQGASLLLITHDQAVASAFAKETFALSPTGLSLSCENIENNV